MPSGSSARVFPAEASLSCPRCRIPLATGTEAACARCSYRLRREDGFWDSGAAVDQGAFPEPRREHLEGIEGRHFWFPARDRLVLAAIDRLGRRWDGVAELGCATGRLLPALAGRARAVFGVDQYAASLRGAAARCPEAVLIRGDVSRVPLADGCLDLVVALDVLEHVDPAAFLAESRR